ncbi:MAG: ACT domain-containing protein [Solirubrobacterales bacterium]
MATDLTVILEDRPGELARLGEVTGQAGINVLGMCALTGEGKGYIHLLVADEKATATRAALEDAGMGVADAREVLVVDIEDRPGTLGEMARRFADSSVNIELAYTTFGDDARLVIATDDLEAARAALE